MNEVIISDTFQNSLKIIMESTTYLPNHFYEKILLKIENLKIFPRMYPISKNPKYRKISFRNYIVIYNIEPNTIRVADIIPTKSNQYNQFY